MATTLAYDALGRTATRERAGTTETYRYAGTSEAVYEIGDGAVAHHARSGGCRDLREHTELDQPEPCVVQRCRLLGRTVARVERNPPLMPNLVFIRRSRPTFRDGDVFRMHHTAGGWLFGRVIATDRWPECQPMPGAMLVYIFAGLRPSGNPEPGWLSPTSLLIPPVFTNGLAWRHGFWETIERRPLAPGDRLDRHVFWRMRGARWEERYYVDECRREVATPPDGRAALWGLWSYRSIDDDISDALGVPRAPLDDLDRAELARRGDARAP